MKKKLYAVLLLVGALLLGGLVTAPAASAAPAPVTVEQVIAADLETGAVTADTIAATKAASAEANAKVKAQFEKSGLSVKSAICYNRIGIKWWWGPVCVNWGYGVPLSCYYAETYCV